MKREEDFPINEDLVAQFNKINKKLWNAIEYNEGYIFVNLSMVRMQMAWLIPKLLYAKGIEEATGYKVIVLTWRKNQLLTELFESFGFIHIVLEDLNRKSVLSFLKSIFKTLNFMIFLGSGKQLKEMKIRGIEVGKSLYEDILRTSSLSTIRSTRNFICLKKMLHLIWTFYSLNEFCQKHKPCFMICDDLAYHENMFIKLFFSHGAKVYRSNNSNEHIITIKNNGDLLTNSEMYRKRYAQKLESVSTNDIGWSEKYLQARYEGKNGRSIDRGAFLGKRVLSRKEAILELGLDPMKKNVVIMAHTFTDAVFNYGDTFFRDYYDWTEQTLKFVSKIDKVNWILKPHPTRKAYNESIDSIENMYEKYKSNNTYILSDDISAESIRNFADILITIGGNAGAEFACEGIPAIIIGKPYYYGFGYTIEFENKKEYFNCLQNIELVKSLNKEQIANAKKIFYLHYHGFQEKPIYVDEFCSILNSEYQNMLDKIALEYFKSNEGTKKYNNNMLEIILKYFQSHDMRQTEYYQRGSMRGNNNNE